MIFIDNKYTRIYYSIISNAHHRVLPKEIYSENHHIIPRSLGGSNEKSNLVRLTAREHFICHRLLTKMVLGDALVSMKYAVIRMSHIATHNTKNRYKPKSITYQQLREHAAEIASTTHAGKIVSASTRQKISQAHKGRTSPTKGMPAWNKGVAMSKEAKLKASNKLKGHSTWNKGQQMSTETKDKIVRKWQEKPLMVCPHCGKQGKTLKFLKFHNDNCKKINHR